MVNPSYIVLIESGRLDRESRHALRENEPSIISNAELKGGGDNGVVNCVSSRADRGEK